MSRNYKNESYMANKYSKGIVYKSVTGDYEITLEQFLRENPNMTEKDFEYWKAISDELYREEAANDAAATRLNVSINDIEETLLVATEPFVTDIKNEDVTLTREDIVNPAFVLRIAEHELSEILLRRFKNRYIEGKKVKEIAAIEGVSPNCVYYSLDYAETKIRKAIAKICEENEIFDVFKSLSMGCQ